jgi:eukaryotic-like serine/threonine-protein kinase
MNSSTPNSWIGRSIGDRQRYRLEKRLGVGGMGDVFLAMDTRIGKQVALKLLKDTLVASKEMRRRFEREVEVCAALDSDNIVKVSDYGVTDEGYPFYVMEYLRGETLRQFLQHERPSLEQTVSIITQVCKGLQLAHKGVTLWREGATVSEHIQVVHRDLKPDNIFLVPTDSGKLVKIVDFGIAKIRNESAEQTNFTNAFIGTFRYAAPEQLRGEINLDGRADIYSLGIILYEMLSAADPFGFSIKSRNISEASWIFAHTGEPPRPLRSQLGCENFSKQLEAVVMRCLEKKPGDRFASVEELNLALRVAAESSAFDNLLEETIAQAQAWSNEGSDEETIARPLNPAAEIKREETIAQIPLAKPMVEHKHEETIAQIPLANPVVEHKHEETIAQIPPVANPVVQHKEETIAQIPPVANPVVQHKEETIAQIPPVVKSKREETIAQIPLVSSAIPKSEETIAQLPAPAKPLGPNNRKYIAPPQKKSLPLSAIIPIALVVVSGIGGIAYFQLQPLLVLNEIKALKTKENYQECIAKSEKVSQNIGTYQEVQVILNECRIGYITKLVKDYQCVEASAVSQAIPENNPLRQEAQTLIKKSCEI